MDKQEIALNATACLKSANFFGFERVNNICTGTIIDVPWGTLDWVAVIGLTAAGVAATLMFCGMAWRIITDF